VRLQPVANRATYGVWGSIVPPRSGSTPDNLEDGYTSLLAQFERRHRIEFGGLCVPVPSPSFRRRSSSEVDASTGADSAIA
jgi:hypothetical protein